MMQHPLIDFIAYGPDGKVVLLAEAKSRRGTSESWAAKLRRNMLAHGMLPSSQFFLIATPERMYGWSQENLPPSEVPPQFLVDAKKVLQPYFAKLKQNPKDISPSAFELLILTWLTDIARSTLDQIEPDPSLAPLVESGLLSSLQEAQIELNTGK
jgi:hypothetical protein